VATEGGVSARLEAIVLAAGFGSRFGGGKLLAGWRGGVLLDGALATAFAAPVRSVALVSGADRRVETAAREHATRSGQGERLRIVHAVDHARGMSASLRAGLTSLPDDAAGVFVFLGDMPAVPSNVLASLADGLARGAPAAAPAFEGRRGHPVLFSRALFDRLLALDGDEGARRVLANLGEALILVPTSDPGVLLDIDRPEDLEEGRGT
jgi:molybdenum cofactor cytidylyltransferase